MRQEKKVAILLLLIPLLTGCYTPSQLIADNLVDELCAKDGGIKVYETVTLPKERFNQWGQFPVRTKDYAKPTDEYYMVWKITDIQGNHNSNNMEELTVYQSHFWIYRKKDQKILGEDISYARRGGDIPLPVHPSSYSCPEIDEKNDVLRKIFLQLN